MDEKSQANAVGEAVDNAQDGFVELVRDYSPLDGQILLGRLHAEGIDAHLSGLEVVQNNPYWRNAFGGVRIFVRAQQLVEAGNIVASVNAGDYAQEETSEETNSPQPGIHAKRLFGWIVVLLLTLVFGGIALAAIWSPSYDYFPYSMTPEPMAHIVGKWVLSTMVLMPGAFWLYFVEASIKRKKKR
jgi:hypothetical protein